MFPRHLIRLVAGEVAGYSKLIHHLYKWLLLPYFTMYLVTCLDVRVVSLEADGRHGEVGPVHVVGLAVEAVAYPLAVADLE